MSAIFLPLAVALLLPVPWLGRLARRVLAPLVPLPALWLALFGAADSGATLDSLVLGLELGFGPAGQVFLLFTSVLWLVAGVYAQGYFGNLPPSRRFHGFFLLTMTGNFGLILAQDVPGFYTFFALMTFSAFGLVIYSGTAQAQRAARIYLTTAVLGEALLLGAMFLAVAEADSVMLADLGAAVARAPQRDLIILLTLFGFGVKAGAVPVHFWLPLAHPVAPVPASAVLSGAMIKAGLLGWLHFLPLGHGAFPGWSGFLVVLGLVAAFGAALVGWSQEDPKTTLAYSSISQMGVMMVILGLGLSGPEAWAAAFPVLLLYALNHALAKGALFFGIGIALFTGRSRWVPALIVAGLAVPALTLAGAPWTGGSMVKGALKDLAAGLADPVIPWLGWLLPLTAAATAMLLGRFLWLALCHIRANPPGGRAHPLMWTGWLALLAGVVIAVAFSANYYMLAIMPAPGSLAAAWKDAWPILLGLGLLVGLGRVLGGRGRRVAVAPGDVVLVIERCAVSLRHWWLKQGVVGPWGWNLNLAVPLERLAARERRSDLAKRLEERMRYRSVPAILFILLVLALVALLLFGTPLQ